MALVYLTTPIYYVNAEPHVGHAYTTVNCDAMARWHRLNGDEVRFLTGTDHHGLKIQRAAEAAGETPQVWGDRNSQAFVDAFALLNVSNNDFIRTSEARHYETVQWMLQRVKDNGYIHQGTYEGLYCVGCEAYFERSELVEVGGISDCCPIHKRPVEFVTEDNYFFRLSAFEDRLLAWLDAHPDAVTPVTLGRRAMNGQSQSRYHGFTVAESSRKTPNTAAPGGK